MKFFLIIILILGTSTSIKSKLVRILDKKSGFSYEVSSRNELDASTHVNDLFEDLNNNNKACCPEVTKFLDSSK